jgi:REP element-mobilizing transposase RayT
VIRAVSRRSRRLKGWDYADEGGYFVTLVSVDRVCLFGDIIDREMCLSEFGRIARDEWLRSEVIRPDIALDESVVMPKYLHAILWIARKVDASLDSVAAHSGALPRGPRPGLARPARSLGSIIAGFKSATTKRINELRGTPGVGVWQSNYYDRVIRNDYELDRIRTYIARNPETWADDSIDPNRTASGT